jgi:hypothetical protein
VKGNQYAHAKSWAEYLEGCTHIAKCPPAIADHHRTIAKHLHSQPPEYLQANLGDIGGQPQHCFDNCSRFIDERQWRYKKPLFFTLGWSLWEFTDFSVVAEGHAVVTTPGGLLDCTPQIDRCKRILFCPHSSYRHWSECLDLMDEMNERNKNFPLCEAAVEWCDIANTQYCSTDGGVTVRKDEENKKCQIYDRWVAARQEEVAA